MLLHLHHFLLRRSTVNLVLVGALPQRLLLSRLHLVDVLLDTFHLSVMRESCTLARILLATHLLVEHSEVVELPSADSVGRLIPSNHYFLSHLVHGVMQADACGLLLQLYAFMITPRGCTRCVIGASH